VVAVENEGFPKERTKKRSEAVPVREPSRVADFKVMSFTPEVDSFEELSSSG
jgi:hypothetical protein